MKTVLPKHIKLTAGVPAINSPTALWREVKCIQAFKVAVKKAGKGAWLTDTSNNRPKVFVRFVKSRADLEDFVKPSAVVIDFFAVGPPTKRLRVASTGADKENAIVID